MRRRTLVLVFSTTLFALVLLGVILMTVIWQVTDAATQSRADASATVASAAIVDILDASGRLTRETLTELQFNDAVLKATIVSPEGTTVLVTGDPVDGSAWYSSVESSLESMPGTVTVEAWIPKALKVSQVAQQAVIVAIVSVVALSVSMLVAWYYTRRITQPFEDFKEFIASVATGDRRGLKKRYGLPEIDMVAEVLDTGVSRFDEMLERERQATQDASHQLKSPLTAISMRLEEITLTDDIDVAREEATVALAQVERLSAVVDEVVGVRRGQRSSMPVDFSIDDMVRGQVEEWTPAYRAAGREITVTGRRGITVHAESGAQAQALATLLENSLAHGAGVTSIRIRQTAGWAVVEVADQGPGVPIELEGRVFDRSVSGARSSGLGLSVARTLVSGDGGRLELISARPAVFAMFLPAVEERADADPAGAPATEPGQDQAVVLKAASSAASSSSGNTQRR